jgi:hypothetical protein
MATLTPKFRRGVIRAKAGPISSRVPRPVARGLWPVCRIYDI